MHEGNNMDIITTLKKPTLESGRGAVPKPWSGGGWPKGRGAQAGRRRRAGGRQAPWERGRVARDMAPSLPLTPH